MKTLENIDQASDMPVPTVEKKDKKADAVLAETEESAMDVVKATV